MGNWIQNSLLEVMTELNILFIMATRAEPTAPTTEGKERFMMAVRTFHTSASPGEDCRNQDTFAQHAKLPAGKPHTVSGIVRPSALRTQESGHQEASTERSPGVNLGSHQANRLKI
jgi:hypothetical protein